MSLRLAGLLLGALTIGLAAPVVVGARPVVPVTELPITVLDGDATCVTYKYPQGQCSTSVNAYPNDGDPTGPLQCAENGPWQVDVTMFECWPGIDGASCALTPISGSPYLVNLTETTPGEWTWSDCFTELGDVPKRYVCWSTSSAVPNPGFEDLWIEICCVDSCQ
jgi:hypothetical protein